MITTIFATALLAVAPTVRFTSDSAYVKERAIEWSAVDKHVVETDDATGDVVSDEHFYTLSVKEGNVLGYCVYDNPDTAYIDGIKVDGEFLPSDWEVKGFDIESTHEILVKTVHSDDIAGWLASAKDGDFSALMSHPVVVIQFVYYGLAAISIILGGFGLLKSRKNKAKTSNEIAGKVTEAASKLNDLATEKLQGIEDKALAIVMDVMTPALELIKKQNDTLLEATVLARSGDEQSTLALLDLLKKNSNEGIEGIADAVKAKIEESKAEAEKAKAEAIAAMKEAVAEISVPAAQAKGGYDGTSI